MAARKRICIVSMEPGPDEGAGGLARMQAEVLAEHHEVTLIESPELSPALASLSFASEDHRRSAAALGAIEAAYESSAPPDYVEFRDHRAAGLVPLQARLAGHELLRETLVGIQLSGTAELIALHDGTAEQPEEARAAELEREQLRLADLLLWPGGGVLDLYRRHYRDLRLPRAVRVGLPFPAPEVAPAPPPPAGGPLRILYVGHLQRSKGALDLAEACLRLPAEDWQLTMIGADTRTAPMGQSVRMTIEMMCGEDPRVRIEEPLPREELRGRFAEHDLLVVPSTFEVCATVALEAMRAGLPVLTTPGGAQAEIVEHRVSGWLAEGTGAEALARALGELLERRDEVAAVRASGAVFERFRRFTDPEAFLAVYEELLVSEADRPSPPSRRPEGSVTAVVPYYRAHRYAGEAVGSLLAQTHRELDVVLVNDGSFDPEDGVLDKLAADPRVRLVHQLNQGDGIARNLGVALAGSEYLMMFDADNVLEPEFVARALQMLRADPELAYVTCWLRFVGPDGEELDGRGYAPLGNRVVAGDEENWDGDTTALFSRRALDRLPGPFDPRGGMHGDWHLYRRLRERGEYGAVIPEPLARYRVHPESLLRAHDLSSHKRGWAEGRSWRRLDEATLAPEGADG